VDKPKLMFATNIPQTIALAYDDGRAVDGRFGTQYMYSLAEPADHIAYFPEVVDVKIHELGIGRGELFTVCKREVQEGRRKAIRWQVERLAETGIEDSELMRDLKASHKIAKNGTGTWAERQRQASERDSQAARREQPSTARPGATDEIHFVGTTSSNHGKNITPLPPVKIPMDEAVIDAVRQVQRALRETGEQWGDEAKQALVSTLLIQAGREGWIAPWKRGVA
jgi:hypothetical protein